MKEKTKHLLTTTYKPLLNNFNPKCIKICTYQSLDLLITLKLENYYYYFTSNTWNPIGEPTNDGYCAYVPCYDIHIFFQVDEVWGDDRIRKDTMNYIYYKLYDDI